MQAAIKLNGSNSVSYKPTVAALSRSTYSEIQLDFRTRQSNAFLMLFGNSSATSMVRIYWLQAKIALKSMHANMFVACWPRGDSLLVSDRGGQTFFGFVKRCLVYL